MSVPGLNHHAYPNVEIISLGLERVPQALVRQGQAPRPGESRQAGRLQDDVARWRVALCFALSDVRSALGAVRCALCAPRCVLHAVCFAMRDAACGMRDAGCGMVSCVIWDMGHAICDMRHATCHM